MPLMPRPGCRTRIALMWLGLPTLAAAQGVTVHDGLTGDPVAIPGFELEVYALSGSPQAGLRFASADNGINLQGPSGCRVDFTDQDGDGELETRRTRLSGRLVGACPRVPSQFTRSSLEAETATGRLAGCRVESRPDGDVVCQPTQFGRASGEPWTIASGVGGHSLAWWQGTLILDDRSGTIYRLIEVPVAAPAERTWGKLIDTRPGRPERPRETRLSDTEETVSAERQAIIDKQREAFPRAFQEQGEQTPEAARAFTGAAARAARRSRERADKR